MQSVSEIERKIKEVNPDVKLNQKILDTLMNGITDNEEILYAISGNSTCESNLPGVGRTVKDAVIFLTNKKVFIVIKNVMSCNLINIPFENIKSVSTNKIIFGRTLITLSYNAMNTEMAVNSSEEANQFINILNNQLNKSGDYGEEIKENPKTDEDILEKIEKLSELYKQGIITEEEFTAKKRELLNKL